MYKDVGKRILALVLMVCMVVTLVEWPVTVQAAESRNYYTYQQGSGGASGSNLLDAATAAMIFQVGQAGEGSTEILDAVKFDVHVEDGVQATADVKCYTGNADGVSVTASGLSGASYQWDKSLSGLTEGTNTLQVGAGSGFAQGTTVALVIRLTNASFYSSSSRADGVNYAVAEDGSWTDVGTGGACAAVSAVTCIVKEEEESSIINEVASLFSSRTNDASVNSARNNENVALDKKSLVVAKGSTVEVTLTGAGTNVDWSIADPEIADISQSGNKLYVMGTNAGTTTVTAVYGGVSYDCKVTVVGNFENEAEITLSQETTVYNGGPQHPEITVKIGDVTLVENESYQVAYCTSAPSNQELAGVLTPEQVVDVGTYYIVITATAEGLTGRKTFTYEITKKDISDSSVEIEFNEETWQSAKDLTAVTAIRDTVAGKNLKDETDAQNSGDADALSGYTLRLVDAEDGGKDIEITGTNNYTGTRTFVTPRSLAESGATITFIQNDGTSVYTGEGCEPAISVKAGGNILGEDDYDIIYENNVNAANASDANAPTVTVQGKGDYYGEISKTFTILQKDIGDKDAASVGIPIEVTTYTTTSGSEPNLTVAYNGMTLEKGVDYIVGSPTEELSAGQATCTITGQGNFTGTREVKYVVTGQENDLSILVNSIKVADTVIYDGSKQEPAFTLYRTMDDGSEAVLSLVEGTDYTVSYSNNINAGNDATITVRGINTYSGTAEGTFTIDPASFDEVECRIVDEDGKTYTDGTYKTTYTLTGTMKPHAQVRYHGLDLEEGTDYEVTYSQDGSNADSLAAGKVTIQISNKTDNFSGNSKTLGYTINSCNLGDAVTAGEIVVTLNSEVNSYTGSAVEPAVELVYAADETKKLAEGTDYKLTRPTTSTEMGSYEIRVSGQGNYEGSVKKYYQITGIDVSTLKVAPAENQPGKTVDGYSGQGNYMAMLWYNNDDSSKNKLSLTLTNREGIELVEDKDYTLDYDKIDGVSTAESLATVTITGKGSYSGERVLYYLLAGNLTDYKLNIKEENLIYTGKPQTLQTDSIEVYKPKWIFFKDALEQGVDYTVEYTDDHTDAGDAGITIRAMSYDKLPTSNGCYIYEPGATDPELKGTYPIQKKNIEGDDIALEPITKEYTGSKVTLKPDDIVLTYNGMTLNETRTDFVIDSESYGHTGEIGENASVDIEGQGNYTGSRTIPFTITGKSLENEVTASTVADAVYTGAELYPEILELSTKDGVLILGTDYTYTKDADCYSNNLNAADKDSENPPTIKVTGIGSYEGSEMEIPFTIRPRDISEGKSSETDGSTCTVEGIETAGYTFTSGEIRPDVTVKTEIKGGNNQTYKYTLTENSDYTLDFEDNRNVGTAKIIVTGTGNYTGSVEKSFDIQTKSLKDTDISLEEFETQEYTGAAIRPVPNLTYQYGTGEEDVYVLTTEDYAVEYATGTDEDCINPGKVTIRITGKGNFTGEIEASYTIGTSISDEGKFAVSCADIESGKQFVYNGSAYEPSVKVTNLLTNTLLAANKDYKVEYANNTDAGTATIRVVGMGTYAGTQELTFVITPKNITEEDVVLAIADVVDGTYTTPYTGMAVEPAVSLTYNKLPGDDHKLALGSDYKVTYEGDHTKVGKVSVTVTATGKNYTGTISGTAAAGYEITKSQIGSGNYTPKSGFRMEALKPQPYVAGGVCPVPTLWYRGTALNYGTDYTCTWENNTTIGEIGVVTLTGTGNYTGSVKQQFHILANIADAEITIPASAEYKDYATATDETTVEFKENELVLTMDGQTLTKDTDYEVSYENNTWVGRASAVITGIGDYAGAVSKEFLIQASLSESEVNMTVGDQGYTGEAVTPIPVIEYYGTALVEGRDFIITSYENNIELGENTASVTVVGISANGFSGTKKANFSIVVDESGLTISGAEESYLYRGEAIKPKVTVTAGTKELTEGVDYDLSYGTNTVAGEKGFICAIGKDSYVNRIGQAFFEISPQSIEELSILDGNSEGIADREYTGEAILPELKLQAKVGTAAYTMPESDYYIKLKEGSDNISVGTVTLIMEGTGKNITGSREVTFEITPKSLAKPASGSDAVTVALYPDSVDYDGTEKTVDSIDVTYRYGADAERTLVKDTDYEVTYSDNINAGDAKVTITGKGNYKDSRTVTFKINPKDLSSATVALPAGDTYPYMGAGVAVIPETAVTLDGVTLAEGSDYTVECTNNTSVGTASAAITGTGNYTGTKEQSYTIEEHDIAADDIVLAEIPNQAYTGEAVIPELNMTLGEYQLQRGRDYNLSVTDNVEFGTAHVTITGTNGFSGTRTTTFVIAKGVDKAEIEGLAESYPFKGSPYSGDELGITKVKVGTTELTAADYTVAFAKESDGMSVGTQTLVLTGQGEYGGQKEMSITITPKDIADADVIMTGFANSLPYADNLTQDITLTWNAITLVRDTDYVVTCSPSERAGIYTMTVEGTGNYTGSITKDFAIEQSELGEAMISGVSSTYTYTGSAITPEPVVKMDGMELTEGEDYTLSYENNVNAGVAKLVVTGTGKNFTGTTELTFQILRRSINLGTFGTIPDQIYTNEEIRPGVSVSDRGKVLVESTDYTLMYVDNRKAGVAKVSVGGKGNYTATKTLEFKISAGNVKTIAVTGASNSTLSLGWTGQGVVTGYEIYRATANGKYELVARTRGTSYTDGYLNAGTEYCYQVRSYLVVEGETYYGEFSTIARGTTSQ